MGLFNKKEVVAPPVQGGMFDGILMSLVARYGVTQEHIDKVKIFLDKVEVTDKVITINLGGTVIKIDR